MKIMTGKTGTPHVTSQQFRQLVEGTVGQDSYILTSGENLEPELQTNNLLKIRSGMMSHHGNLSIVDIGTYDEITIANGTQGMQRIDLVVNRYTRDESSGIEANAWIVIQGAPAASNPQVPAYTEGNLQEGDLVDDCPVFEVHLNGINVTEVVKLLEVSPDIPTLNASLSELIGDLFEQKILWSGYYLMTSNHTARLSEPISAMTRGITLIFSKYTGGQPRDYNFQAYYIPKKVIEILPAGPGFQVPIYDGDNIGYKYLYIHDEKILGNDSNETPPNNLYVLRYVIGE